MWVPSERTLGCLTKHCNGHAVFKKKLAEAKKNKTHYSTGGGGRRPSEKVLSVGRYSERNYVLPPRRERKGAKYWSAPCSLSRTLMQSSLQVETDKHFFCCQRWGIRCDNALTSVLEHSRQHLWIPVLPISNAEGCMHGHIRKIEVQSQADVVDSCVCGNYPMIIFKSLRKSFKSELIPYLFYHLESF